jgi:hypothetical protein
MDVANRDVRGDRNIREALLRSRDVVGGSPDLPRELQRSRRGMEPLIAPVNSIGNQGRSSSCTCCQALPEVHMCSMYCTYSTVQYSKYSKIAYSIGELCQCTDAITERADDRYCSSDSLTTPLEKQYCLGHWGFGLGIGTASTPLARKGSNRRKG